MAMTYTKSQLEFFTKYQISLDEVFDASGMKLAQYKEEMAEGGFLVAIGVTPCTKQGHGVRNRHGKCVQCQPACLSYGNRYHQTASVYIAYSENAKLIKIGISSDIVDRIEQLNIHQYGGFKDWNVIYSVNCESAGSVENEVHN